MAAYRDSACNTSLQAPLPPSAVPDLGIALTYCPDLFVGHVPDSQACNLTQECAPGSRCAGGPPRPVYGYYPGLPMPVTLTPSPGLCIAYQKDGRALQRFERLRPASFVPDAGVRVRAADAGRPAVHARVGPADGPGHQQLRRERRAVLRPGLHVHLPALPARRRAMQSAGVSPVRSRSGAKRCPAISSSRDSASRRAKKVTPAAASHRPVPRGSRLPRHAAGRHRHVRGPAGARRAVAPIAAPARRLHHGHLRHAGQGADRRGVQHDAIAPRSRARGSRRDTLVCAVERHLPSCVGAGVTEGNVTGFGGTGGTGGFGGTFITGVGGSRPAAGGTVGSRRRGRRRRPIRSAASSAPPLRRMRSSPTSPAPTARRCSRSAARSRTRRPPREAARQRRSGRRAARHATTTGRHASVLGRRHLLQRQSPAGTACVDASDSHGVQFDVARHRVGDGCTVQYSTNDSAHTDNLARSQGSGPPGAYRAAGAVAVTPTATTVRVPFSGPLRRPAATPPSPSTAAVRPWRSVAVHHSAAGVEQHCVVDFTIDNVRFF